LRKLKVEEMTDILSVGYRDGKVFGSGRMDTGQWMFYFYYGEQLGKSLIFLSNFGQKCHFFKEIFGFGGMALPLDPLQIKALLIFDLSTCKLASPTPETMLKLIAKIPPTIGSGMVAITAPTFVNNPNNTNMQPANCIVKRLATRVTLTRATFSE
jgi:hypothetical protein